MKRYGILALAVVFVFAFVSCKEFEDLRAKFVQSGPYFGVSAYVNKIIYTSVDDKDKEGWVFLDKWNPFDGNHAIYYMEQRDDSCAGLKYVKRTGVQGPVGWDEEKGIMVTNTLFLYNIEEISKSQWKKETKEIAEILVEYGIGIIEAQMMMAKDLGLIETNETKI